MVLDSHTAAEGAGDERMGASQYILTSITKTKYTAEARLHPLTDMLSREVASFFMEGSNEAHSLLSPERHLRMAKDQGGVWDVRGLMPIKRCS